MGVNAGPIPSAFLLQTTATPQLWPLSKAPKYPQISCSLPWECRHGDRTDCSQHLLLSEFPGGITMLLDERAGFKQKIRDKDSRSKHPHWRDLGQGRAQLLLGQ